MSSEDNLKSGQWYWIRKPNGVTIPYRFHRSESDLRTGNWGATFYVGSMLVTFPPSQVVGEARMPEVSRAPRT
jgi:hypothetical protein